MRDLEEIKALPVYPEHDGDFLWYDLELGDLIKKVHTEDIGCHATTEFAMRMFDEYTNIKWVI